MTQQEAKELFERGSNAVKQLRAIEQRKELASLDLHAANPEHVISKGSEGSGAVARQGTYLADMSGVWAAEEQRLNDEIAECQKLCFGVGLALGMERGVLMESHYLRLYEWKQVANMLSVSLSTAYTMQRMVLDYVATVGPKRAKEGLGVAEQ